MPPVVWGGSSARQTFSPVVSTSMSCAQSSGVTMSCADSSHATPSHAQYRNGSKQRQQAGGCHRAVAPRARAGAAAPPPPAAARPLPREPSGGSSASGRCVAQRSRGRADADRGGSRSRCGSSRYATDGLLISRDTTAAVPSAGRDAAAREAASTAPAGPYRRYMAGQKKKKSVFGDRRSQSTIWIGNSRSISKSRRAQIFGILSIIIAMA